MDRTFRFSHWKDLMKESEVYRYLKNYIIFPDRKRLFFLFKWITFVYCFFFLVYSGTNWLNSNRTYHYRLYFPWETTIPLVSPFIFIYLSTFFSFFFPMFFLKYDEINLLGFRYIFIVFISGIIFLIFPTQLGFQRNETTESFSKIYSILYMVDKPYNLFPSLHIGFSAITVFTFIGAKFKPLKWFLFIWLILITISVIAVHQHHLADIAGGYIVSILSMLLIRPSTIKSPDFWKNIFDNTKRF